MIEAEFDVRILFEHLAKEVNGPPAALSRGRPQEAIDELFAAGFVNTTWFRPDAVWFRWLGRLEALLRGGVQKRTPWSILNGAEPSGAYAKAND